MQYLLLKQVKHIGMQYGHSFMQTADKDFGEVCSKPLVN